VPNVRWFGARAWCESSARIRATSSAKGERSQDDLIGLLLAQRAASGPRWTRALEPNQVILRRMWEE